MPSNTLSNNTDTSNSHAEMLNEIKSELDTLFEGIHGVIYVKLEHLDKAYADETKFNPEMLNKLLIKAKGIFATGHVTQICFKFSKTIGFVNILENGFYIRTVCEIHDLNIGLINLTLNKAEKSINKLLISLN